MIGFLLRSSVKLLMLSALLYVSFFVPVGERTVYEHVSRIATSQEAKEFGGELGTVLDRIKHLVGEMDLGNAVGSNTRTR